jgi:hypothetical protein
MSKFPIVNNLDKSVVDAIANTDKVKFSGTKVFAALQCFLGFNNVGGIIGNTAYNAFNIADEVNNSKRRIPPIITGIDVKTAGSLGAIKKAEVTVRFSDIRDVMANSGFLKIGKTQLLVWGWSKGRDGNAISLEMGVGTAKTAINAKDHYNFVVGKDFDIHAGILTNFSIKANSDLSIDVMLELSQPSDIPAFLALENKQHSSRVEKTEDETSKGTALAAQAAKLDPEKDDASTYQNLLQFTINVQDEVFDWTYGNTDTPYIQLGYIVKTICNKGSDSTMGDMPVDIRIDEAIASGRQQMISCSENIIIPCADLPETNTDGESQIEGKKVKVLKFTGNSIPFGPMKLSYDMKFPESNAKTFHGATLDAYKWGYVKNLFISAEFVKECAKGSESNKDFLVKILNEINIAGAGLWDLALRDIEDEATGHMVYTIVDYNLSHDIVPPPFVPLFSPHSTITNIDLQADLPKELAGQAMLGGDNQGGDTNPAKAIWVSQEVDPVLGAVQKAAANYGEHGATSGDANSGTTREVEDNRGWVKTGLDALGNALTGTVNAVADAAGAAAAAVKEFFMKMFNAPGEFRVKLNPKDYYSGSEESYFVVVKDAGLVKNLYFGPQAEKTKNALLPVKLTFTTLGVGGFVVGRALNVPYIPWLEGMGYWQITDITQKISDTKWEIDVEVRFRVKLGG